MGCIGRFCATGQSDLEDSSVVIASQLGDTSLPNEQPEMLDDDFLQKLHHVLLEVSNLRDEKGLMNLGNRYTLKKAS